jgi:hypothetical protein
VGERPEEGDPADLGVRQGGGYRRRLFVLALCVAGACGTNTPQATWQAVNTWFGAHSLASAEETFRNIGPRGQVTATECAELASEARTATTAPPIPASALQRYWQTYVTAISSAARECAPGRVRYNSPLAADLTKAADEIPPVAHEAGLASGASASSLCRVAFDTGALNFASGTVGDLRNLAIGPALRPAPAAFAGAGAAEPIAWCWTGSPGNYTLYAVAHGYQPVRVEGLSQRELPDPGPAAIP